MKLKKLVNITKNKSNKQVSFNLKARQLKKIGIKPEQLLNLNISKIYLNRVRSKTNSCIAGTIQKQGGEEWKK